MDKISRINPLFEVLKSDSRRVEKIFIQKDPAKRDLREIIRMAGSKKIPVFIVPKNKLERLDRTHQGVVAFLSRKEFSSLESILSSSSKLPFLVLLDEIEDPQNLGAVIRSAEVAGVDGIILPERRSAGLTSSVFSVSAGAAEHIRVTKVQNLARTMEILKKRGIWLVGAEGGQQEYWCQFDYRVPVGLVFGSENKGLRPLIKKKCDKILSLPLLGNIPSLNVSAAAAVFIYEVVRQRNFDRK